MIYLDNAATTLRKAPGVGEAMVRALAVCGNPGRSGHRAAVLAEQAMFRVRTLAGVMFDCPAERVWGITI